MFFFLMIQPPPRSTLFPYTTLFRSVLDNSPFSGGIGSEMYPYQVSTIEQLQKIRNYSDKFYKQTNDIDASQTKNWNDGRGFLPIGDDLIQFSGNYDGSNFKITHLTINNFDEASGLFGRTKSANIKNLSIIDAFVNIGGGGILASVMNGTINNIKISGTVVTRSEVAGGIVGENEGIINNSHSEVHIRSISQSNVIGGFVGNNIGEIYNSTSISIVDGS